MKREFNPAFLLMQPRELEEVLDSLSVLDIDMYAFVAFNEPQVCMQINRFVSSTDYTHYIISADDLVLNKASCDRVLDTSKVYHDSGELKVVTGWCNMYIESDGAYSELSNVCDAPLKLSNKVYPVIEDYSFVKIADAKSKEGQFNNYLTSFAFSCIPREVLTKHKMATYANRAASDHNLSYRMHNADGFCAVSDKGMFFRHLKGDLDKSLKKKWLVGKRPPAVMKLNNLHVSPVGLK